MNKRKISLLVVGTLLVLTLLLGTSYALWTLNLFQTGDNTVSTSCFKIEFQEKNNIQLQNVFPIYDEEGKKLTPYEFTVTNTCDSVASYQVNLEILNKTTLEHHEYMKVMYNEGVPRLLTDYKVVEKTLDDASTSYKLDTGFLDANETKTFTLRVWMDENVTLQSEGAQNKTFASKVTITTAYEEKMPGMLRSIARFNDTNGLWEYRSDITKIIIQDKLEEIPNSVKKSDESSLQDGSIMSYVVLNEDGETYTAYLQGNKMIYLNSDSSYLFAYFIKLETIEGMEYLDTSNVINMSQMFLNCDSLTILDLSHFDTSNVTDMSYMFGYIGTLANYKGSKITNLDLKSFDTSNVTNMNGMFSNCGNLTNLDLSFLNTINVTNMSSMFLGCSSLTSLDLSPLKTENVTNMSSMFKNCRSLTSLDLSSLKTENVTNMSSMFEGCSSLTSLDLSPLKTENVTNMSSMFEGCSSLTSLDLSPLKTENVTNMSRMFLGCSSLTSLDLSSLKTENVTNMSSMFSSCSNLTSLDLSSLKTENVTNMSSMFEGCSSLTSLDLSSLKIENVTNMSFMFSDCSSLTSLDLSTFNTSNVIKMNSMFANCDSLTSLDLSSFHTMNVTNMREMFYGCNKLASLNLSSFHTENVTDMYAMFIACSNLKTIIYGDNFVYKNGSTIQYMFTGCPANKSTHSSWNGVL